MPAKIPMVLLLSVFALCSFRAAAQGPALGPEAKGVQSSEDALIKGTTDFLADRARENALYIFESRIKDEKFVSCYLPTIYGDLQVASLRDLLVGPQSFWKDALRKDVKTSADGALAAALKKNLGKLLPVLQALQAQMAKGTIAITVGTGAPKIDRIVSTVAAAKMFFDKVNVDARCGIALSVPGNTTDQVQSLKVLPDWLKSISAIEIKDRDAFCKGAEGVLASLCAVPNGEKESYRAVLVQAAFAISTLVEVSQSPKGVSQLSSTTTPSDVMRAVLDLGKIAQFVEAGGADDAKKAMRYVLFFAELTQATSADQVKTVLTAYTLPPVSFGEKRKPVNHVFITAYVGWAGGKVRNSADVGNQNSGGVYAPIGLEFSTGLNSKYLRGSASVFVAPFDFGYPLSLKLNNVNQSATLADVVSPSAGLAYGVPDWPVAFGFAYQVGRKSALTGEREKRTLLFVAFDMPLFALH